jgi:hypothetical protein
MIRRRTSSCRTPQRRPPARTAKPQDLDAIAGHLQRHNNIESATWTVSTES